MTLWSVEDNSTTYVAENWPRFGFRRPHCRACINGGGCCLTTVYPKPFIIFTIILTLWSNETLSTSHHIQWWCFLDQGHTLKCTHEVLPVPVHTLFTSLCGWPLEALPQIALIFLMTNPRTSFILLYKNPSSRSVVVPCWVFTASGPILMIYKLLQSIV